MDIIDILDVLYHCVSFTLRGSVQQTVALFVVSDRCPIVSCLKLMTVVIELTHRGYIFSEMQA